MSISTYKKMMTEGYLYEASQDDEDYVHIGYGKYKDKDHVDDPTAPTFKKDDSGAFVSAKGADKEKPKGDGEKPKAEPKKTAISKTGGFGGDTGTDADFQGDPPEGTREPDDTAGDPEDAWDDEEGRAKPTGKTDADAWEDDPWDALDAEYDELEKSVGDEPEGGKDESITINGQKYKPIKESVNEAVLTISYQPIFDADKKDKLEKIAKKSGLTIRSRGAQGFTVDGKRANVEKFIKATRGLIEIKESIKESKTSNPRKFKEIYERTFRSLK